MGDRRLQFGENNIVTPCPRCGNNREFTAYSERCAEDACEVWVVCRCGYDPTFERPGSKLEDVWGSLDNDTVMQALDVWSDEIRDQEAA